MHLLSHFSKPHAGHSNAGLGLLDVLMILLGVLACLFLLPNPAEFHWH